MRQIEITDEQRYSVELMAGIGIKHADIAAALAISPVTLRKYCKAELSVGKTRTITKVADSLVRQALAGNMTAAIFFLKTQAGWRDFGAAADGRPAKLGKKDEQQQEAKKVGGIFAAPASPKLVVNNKQ